MSRSTDWEARSSRQDILQERSQSNFVGELSFWKCVFLIEIVICLSIYAETC